MTFFIDGEDVFHYTVSGGTPELYRQIDTNLDRLAEAFRRESGKRPRSSGPPTNNRSHAQPQQAARPAARAVSLSDEEMRAVGLRPWTIEAIRRHVKPAERPRVERDQNRLPDRAYKT